MIYDIHTHHHPSEPGTAIVQLMPNDFNPHPGHYYSVGLHPWDITDDWRTQIAKLAVMALHPQVAMIGEAGIDKKHSPVSIELQTEVLREQIKLSELVRKPLLIHCVKAVDELLALRKATKATLPWVLHGYRGGIEQWEQLSRAGLFVSLGKHYDKALVPRIPIAQLIFESDEHPDIKEIYETASADTGMSEQELHRCAWRNIRHVLGWEPIAPF